MPAKTKRPIIVGNWKMYKTAPEALEFVDKLKERLATTHADVLLAVPFTLIREVSQAAAHQDHLEIGAQNMNDASEGAFTGEISASMLKDAGATFVLLGHSERRQYYKESNEFIHKKVKRALQEGLKVILCVGETFDEHVEGRSLEVLEEQLLGCLKELQPDDFEHIYIAYEPIWAVGSGKAAQPQDVAQENSAIQAIIAKQWGENAGNALKILYGGSVNSENAKLFFNEPMIDGVLIGSASLNVADFDKIISQT